MVNISSYRVLYGFGNLPRDKGEAPDQIPSGMSLIYGGDISDDRSILKHLKYRFGGGVDISHNRNIQVAHAWDLGQREATITTQGIREVDWTANGMVMPEHTKWMEYLFCTEPLEIDSTTTLSSLSEYNKKLLGENTSAQEARLNSLKEKITNRPDSGTIPAPALPGQWIMGSNTGFTVTVAKSGVDLESVSVNSTTLTQSQFSFKGTELETIVTIKSNFLDTLSAGDHTVTLVFVDEDFTSSLEVIQSPSQIMDGKIRIFSYQPLNGPNHQIPHDTVSGKYQYRGMFDMIIIKYNEETGIKGDNEITLLLGCIFTTSTINYENGSDAAIKFSNAGYAMVDPTMVFNMTSADYDKIKSWVAEDLKGDVFTFGCLSTNDGTTTEYEPVAETDSSSIDINTGVSRIPDCGKAWYGAYALGNLEYSISTSTYSDDPNKYMSKVYGISKFTNDGFTFPKKNPYLIPYAKIHTQDTLYPEAPNMFLDIDMQKVATPTLNRAYSIGGDALMDDPDLVPRKVQIVVMSSS